MNGQQSLILRAIELSGVGDCGGSGSYGPASYRGNVYPTGSDYGLGFRPALYVNL